MKWTADADRLLLISIVSALNITIGEDAQKVADAFPPNEKGERPTAKAITERLYRIKSKLKTTGTAEPKRAKKATSPKTARSESATPRKPRTPRQPKEPKTPRSSTKKRKGKNAEDEDDDDDLDDTWVPKGKMSRELAALQQENPAFARSGRGATPSKKRAKKEIDYNIKEEKEENTEGDSGAVTEVASENGDASYEDVQQEEHPEQPRVERTDSANIDEPAAQYASFNDKAEGFGGARKIHGLPNLGTSHSSGAFTAPATPHNASFPFNQNGCGAPILMPSVLGAASSYHDLPHNGFSYSQPHAFNNSYSMPNTPITNNFSPWMNGGHGSMAHGNDFGDIQFDGHNSATGTPVSHGALHHSMNAAFGHSQAPLIRPSPVRPYLMHHANTDYTGVDAFKMLPPPISTNARRRNQSFDFGETFLSPDSSPITKVDSQHSSQPSIDTTTSFLSDMDMNMDPHAHLETPSPMNQAPPTGPGFPSFGGAHFPNKGDQDDEDMNIESFY